MPGTLKVGGNIIASHTGVEGAGTVTLGNVVLGDSAVPTNNYTFRNLLINGAAQISQRGDVTGITSTTYGGPDRFQHIMGSAGTFSISQSTDAPDGFSNSIKVACTSSTSLSTGSLYLLGQKIEGQNVQHLEYGSSTAKSLTFSFWVKTNVSGDYAVEFFSQTANRQISKSFNISSAEASAFSWVKRTMTIPGDTVTAVPNNNTAELAFYIWLVAGNDYTSGTLNSSAWASNTNANRALAMNLGSSTSNEFYFTGIQLEEGTVATPFEHRPIGLEQHLCERYYEIVHDAYGEGHRLLTAAWTTTESNCFIPFRTRKRATTSNVTYTESMQLFNGGWGNITGLVLLGSAGHTGVTLNIQRSSALVARSVYFIRNGKITVDAEL